MRHPSTAVGFDWDSANVGKLALRNVRPDEVEAIWANRPRYFRNKREGSATWMMLGRDPTLGPIAQGGDPLER